jgi:hypothetical protein
MGPGFESQPNHADKSTVLWMVLFYFKTSLSLAQARKEIKKHSASEARRCIHPLHFDKVGNSIPETFQNESERTSNIKFYNKMKNSSFLFSAFITLNLLIAGCADNDAQIVDVDNIKVGVKSNDSLIKNQNDNDNDIANEKLTFHIPPPTGPGTGVCQVTLKIENNTLTGIENCGGHNGEEHTETTNKIFSVIYKPNHLYEVSTLFDTENGHSFGCDFFEIKSSKLFLYNKKKEILKEWFCIYGNTTENMIEEEKCDCIFMPSNE